WDGGDLSSLIGRFHRLHDELNGYALPEQQCEVSALHLTSIGLAGKPPQPERPHSTTDAQPLGHRRVVLETGETEIPVYSSGGWPRGQVVAGPCIVELPASTLLLLAGFEAGVDRGGNLLVYLASRRDFAERIAQ
ncbi:MAG TPA: hypothetical protein VHG27_10640, partial [Xanthobacteraceae bacterium]|nr:hypothetical protein [Xanthobacteraceae bacterium]